VRATRTVLTPLTVGGSTIRNRLYRAPVLEGAGDGDDAADAYVKQFAANAEAGVGLIIQGSSCILPEGRTSPGMTLVDTRDKVQRLAPVAAAVHAHGASIWIQLGHGGLYSMEAWHEPYASQRQGPLLAASKPPLPLRPTFRGVPIHVLSTQEHPGSRRALWRGGGVVPRSRLRRHPARSANAKLLDQLLSPFYNRRDDEFGGSLDNRHACCGSSAQRWRVMPATTSRAR
jgi:2,4-dienoyl-CoA reductase-like NADH-dependent reductase (Old Yellow Enzyme family)